MLHAILYHSLYPPVHLILPSLAHTHTHTHTHNTHTHTHTCLHNHTHTHTHTHTHSHTHTHAYTHTRTCTLQGAHYMSRAMFSAKDALIPPMTSPYDSGRPSLESLCTSKCILSYTSVDATVFALHTHAQLMCSTCVCLLAYWCGTIACTI